MLLERLIIRGVLLLVGRRETMELGSGDLLKTQWWLGNLLIVQGRASCRPFLFPPLVKIANLFRGPAMHGVVAPIDVLVRRFLLHEIGQ